MLLQIKEKAKPKKKITNTFKLIIGFMHGDADGDDVVEVKVKSEDYNSNPEVQRVFHDLINVVEGCNNAYSEGRGGCDEYDDVVGYNKWFSEDYEPESEDEKLNTEYERDWKIFREFFKTNSYFNDLEHPSESSMGISASFDGWSLIYYDESGDKYPVSVEFSIEEKEYHAKCKLIK